MAKKKAKRARRSTKSERVYRAKPLSETRTPSAWSRLARTRTRGFGSFVQVSVEEARRIELALQPREARSRKTRARAACG